MKDDICVAEFLGLFNLSIFSIAEAKFSISPPVSPNNLILFV
jgi:hypothetical protein